MVIQHVFLYVPKGGNLMEQGRTAQADRIQQSPNVFRGFAVQINKQIIREVRDTRDPSAKGTQESYEH